MTSRATLDSIAAPADAEHLGDWTTDGDSSFRRFAIHTAALQPALGDPVEVHIDGEQSSDGTTHRAIDVDEAAALTANEARELARLLLEAADLIDATPNQPQTV